MRVGKVYAGVGDSVGARVGTSVGDGVGANVGDGVGTNVGAEVASSVFNFLLPFPALRGGAGARRIGLVVWVA